MPLLWRSSRESRSERCKRAFLLAPICKVLLAPTLVSDRAIMFVESYDDHEPKQQNPQHFYTFILHGWWMVSTNAVIRIYHELISSQVVQIHTLRVTYSQAWQRSCDQRKHVRVTLTSLQDFKLLNHTLSCSCNISMMKLLETIHQPCKMKV